MNNRIEEARTARAAAEAAEPIEDTCLEMVISACEKVGIDWRTLEIGVLSAMTARLQGFFNEDPRGARAACIRGIRDTLDFPPKRFSVPDFNRHLRISGVVETQL